MLMAGLINRVLGRHAEDAGVTGSPGVMRVKELNIYPIKSCKGMAATCAACDITGLPYDRQWMVVAADTGKFFSQRQSPKLCLVSATLPSEVLTGGWQAGACLSVAAPGMPQLKVPLADPSAPAPESSIRRVTVWEWTGNAADEGDAAAEWFSKYLDKPVRLVRHLNGSLPETTRPVDEEFAPGHQVMFADGYPLLIATEESLTDLRKHLGEELPMNRFRPNIVITGSAQPWADDEWKDIQIGDGEESAGSDAVLLQYVKPCDRCKVPTINQETAEAGHDKLEKVLKDVRGGKVLGWSENRKSWTHAVFFGWNAAVKQQGRIAVGDTVQVIQAQA